MEVKQLSAVLNGLRQLPNRERSILKMRYGIAQEGHPLKSLTEIGQLFGISPSQVRTIEREALLRIGRYADEVCGAS